MEKVDAAAFVEALSVALMEAATQGSVEHVTALLQQGADVTYQDEKGRSPLHMACQEGKADVVQALLEGGHAWNVQDHEGRTAGEYAKTAGHQEVYELLLNEGIRTELILGVLGQKAKGAPQPQRPQQTGEQSSGEESKESTTPTNEDYLKRELHYSDAKLLDSDNNAVMMGWEEPLMERHASILCPREGLAIINIGFGLGLIDTFIQKSKPRMHYIVEAHPDVYKHMIETGWDKKPGVTILFGRWQDMIPQHVEGQILFDGIYFDTFGEFYEDLREFHETVPNILNTGGIYSFFNGLGATNPFFHDVYCHIAEMELNNMGISTKYIPINIDPSDSRIWDGVKRRYWTLDLYHLPVCRFVGEEDVEEHSSETNAEDEGEEGRGVKRKTRGEGNE